MTPRAVGLPKLSDQLRNPEREHRSGFSIPEPVPRSSRAADKVLDAIEEKRDQAGIKTAQAANNIDVNTGSAVKVQQGARQAGQLNTETVLNNGELAAYGYRSQGTAFTEQAGLEQMEANEAPIAAAAATEGGELGAQGAIIGGEGAELAATGSLLSNASTIGFKFGSTNSLSSSSSPGTGLSGSQWTISNPFT
jgi:hypothetical protein